MLTVFDRDADAPVDRTLLRYWADWMHRMKGSRKHLQRINHSTEVIDAEIAVLRTCINQVHWSRRNLRDLQKSDDSK